MTVLERQTPTAFLTPLILKAQQRDPRAFDSLCEEHRPLVFRICREFLGNDAEAEQTAQDVLARLWEKLPGFRGECPLHHWLWQLTRNVCRNQLRTLRGIDAVRGLSLDGMPEGHAALITHGFEREIVDRTFVDQLQARIRDSARTASPAWDETDLDIFHLFYEKNVATKREVARRLGMPEDTVKYRLKHRIDPVLAAVCAQLRTEHNAV